MTRKLMNDETGFIVSAELMLLITLAFCMAAVGGAAIRDALVNELNDVAHAIGAVSQSYSVTGITKVKENGSHATHRGFGFNDSADDCDCNVIEYADIGVNHDPSTGGLEDGTSP